MKQIKVKWALCIILTVLMGVGLAGFLMRERTDEQAGYFVWMDYPFGSGDRPWQKAKKSGYFSDGTANTLISLSGSEAGYLIRNLSDEEALCIAVCDKDGDPDEYTIFRFDADGSRTALLSFRAEDVFSFLGFQENTVYFARKGGQVESELTKGGQIGRLPALYTVNQAMNEDLRDYHVIKSSDGKEETLIFFKNKYWKRPSINAQGEILYTSWNDGEEKVFYADGNLKPMEVIWGGDPVWYDEKTFLYIRDRELHRFDLTAFEDEIVLTEDRQPVSIRLHPYVGDGLYLSRDRNAVVYATEKEEKYLFFILSGYFYKCWNVTDLRTGKSTSIGQLQESYDNIMTF